MKSNIGVAKLKYPPNIAHRVFPIDPAKNPIFGPNNIPITHGRNASIRQ